MHRTTETMVQSEPADLSAPIPWPLSLVLCENKLDDISMYVVFNHFFRPLRFSEGAFLGFMHSGQYHLSGRGVLTPTQLMWNCSSQNVSR